VGDTCHILGYLFIQCLQREFSKVIGYENSASFDAKQVGSIKQGQSRVFLRCEAGRRRPIKT
jgi:hypothetical protein